MPIRRRLAAVPVRAVDPLIVFVWSHDGLENVFGGPAYRTRQEAAKAWQVHRRLIWARQHRFAIPHPAAEYDGLTMEGLRFVRSHWNHTGRFRLHGALLALEQDRAALAAFRTKDPKGARAIGDFLTQFEAHLGLVEHTARALAAWEGPWWVRPYPSHLNTGRTYGAGQSADSTRLDSRE